ncbi:unnamed protein product, partial [Oppiella nova]
ENRLVTYLSGGEGYHNYHHTFPFDYSASEYGWKDNWNIATAFIDMFAWIGWAYDRRRPTQTCVKARIARTGDSDHKYQRLTRLIQSQMAAPGAVGWPTDPRPTELNILEWCRDHRVHHRYSETDADPHNAKRGFFFAHMGWLMCRKHPEVTIKGKEIDMSDL